MSSVIFSQARRLGFSRRISSFTGAKVQLATRRSASHRRCSSSLSISTWPGVNSVTAARLSRASATTDSTASAVQDGLSGEGLVGFWSRFAALSWSSHSRSLLNTDARRRDLPIWAFRLSPHLLKSVICGLNRRRVVWMPCQPAASGGLEGPQTSPQGPICPHLAMKRKPTIVPKGNQVASGARATLYRRGLRNDPGGGSRPKDRTRRYRHDRWRPEECLRATACRCQRGLPE